MLNQQGCMLLGNRFKIRNLITLCRLWKWIILVSFVQRFLKVVHLVWRHLAFFCTDDILGKLEAFVGDGRAARKPSGGA